jgi:hypothetical protein
MGEWAVFAAGYSPDEIEQILPEATGTVSSPTLRRGVPDAGTEEAESAIC